MMGAGTGSWSVGSKSDPRWNKSGRGFGSALLGGPKEMRDWIEKCRKKYGEPPKDASMSFWKD